MGKLTERFAVPVGDRDQTIELLKDKGYEVLEAEDGGADFDRKDRPSAVIIVRSADDIEDPSPGLRQMFATAIGDLFDTEDILWRPVAPPSRPR